MGLLADRSRPGITEAALRWMVDRGPTGGREAQIDQAIDDFLAQRFFGFAPRLRAVHEHRRSMFDDHRPVYQVADVENQRDDAKLDLVARTATNPEKGRLLFHLARSVAPGAALELGTSIGISAAYIALGLESGGGGQLVTIDGSEARTTLATDAWNRLGIEGVDLVLGRFDDVLGDVLSRLGLPLRLAYIDGNHHRDPTLRYFERTLEAMDSGVIVFDDIRWSEGMRAAWAEIEASSTATVDLSWVGLVLVG